MRRGAFVLAAVAGSLVFGLTGASGGAEAVPGVTAKVVTIGGTFPLSGPAASYAPIARGIQAYYSYENSTKRGADKARGCGGRQVKYIVYDDAFNPTQTVLQTIRLVQQDKVFATVGGLGTEPQQNVRAYLNKNGVPQVYVSTGATFWGSEQKDWKWTIGWQPDYQGEGAIYGRRIKNQTPNAKIAIIYQNDDYGKDYIAGLEAGLGSNKSQIVATRGYNLTDASVAPQLLFLRGSGADTLMIFATPTHTIRTYATMRAIGWRPANVYLNSVSATDTFMTLALANSNPATVNGSISVQYLKDPASSEWANDAGMRLYKQIMAKYLPNAKVTDGLYLYGFAKARSFCNVLDRIPKGKLTRASLMAKVLNFTETDKMNPLFLPGVSSTTSKNDKFPISAERLIEFENGDWKAIGQLVDPRPAPKKK
ncbi:MAG TPA: ABC transporter substrate-binding protein [Gaiellaceae bacterium]|nr:ABC transporter substrate-binding protein [Gaiellaceae bacterium]